jgi:hypothetical protein
MSAGLARALRKHRPSKIADCQPIKRDQFFGHGHVQMLGFKSFPGRESHGRAATGAMAAYLFYMFDALHIYSFYISRNKRPILLELAH